MVGLPATTDGGWCRRSQTVRAASANKNRVNTGLTPSTATVTMVAPAKTRARAIRGTQLSTVTQRDLVALVVVSESLMHASPVLWVW